MENVLSRYRTLVILVGVLFLQILGLAVQVRRTTENTSTRLIRVWAVAAISPLEQGLVHLQSSASYLWHDYFYLRGVRQQNRDLKAENDRLKLEQVRLSQDAEQAHRLQVLLGFKERVISQTLAAQVIGTSGSELSRSVYLDKGAHDGLKPDMAVITADGVVGKVLKVYPTTALVLLINDQTSGVGVILSKSRLQGVLRGTANGELVVEKVMADEQVPVGEPVLTSGGDGIFPKGMPVGTVTQTSPGAELFLNIRVKPVANLAKVEEVLVVTKKEELAPTLNESGPIRASDILAQRLPGVPQTAAAPGDAANAANSGVPKTQTPGTAGTAGASSQLLGPVHAVLPKAGPQTGPQQNTSLQSPGAAKPAGNAASPASAQPNVITNKPSVQKTPAAPPRTPSPDTAKPQSPNTSTPNQDTPR